MRKFSIFIYNSCSGFQGSIFIACESVVAEFPKERAPKLLGDVGKCVLEKAIEIHFIVSNHQSGLNHFII